MKEAEEEEGGKSLTDENAPYEMGSFRDRLIQLPVFIAVFR